MDNEAIPTFTEGDGGNVHPLVQQIFTDGLLSRLNTLLQHKTQIFWKLRLVERDVSFLAANLHADNANFQSSSRTDYQENSFTANDGG